MTLADKLLSISKQKGVRMKQLVAQYKETLNRRYAEGTAFWYVIGSMMNTRLAFLLMLVALAAISFVHLYWFLGNHEILFFFKGAIYAIMAGFLVSYGLQKSLRI